LTIWLYAGMRRTGEIRLSVAPLQGELGVSRTAAYRALRLLERAHLIAVVRHKGRKPIVRLLDHQRSQPMISPG
jgi:DNA-binding GntR family transcriptional regulator